MHPFTTIGIAILMGAFNAYLAHRKGKNPYLWFSVGFLFGLIGIIIFLILNRTKAPKEPVVEEAAPVAIPEPIKCIGQDRFWYFLDKDRKQCGPLSFLALKKEFYEGNLTNSSFVWNEEMDNWKQIKDIANFDN
ncbi:MAG TPA: DUF4339 domain-containing protein [Chlamydiales bacterium]|nr:DUF4339 domain-containing protein [Chlamydiales bacterium]